MAGERGLIMSARVLNVHCDRLQHSARRHARDPTASVTFCAGRAARCAMSAEDQTETIVLRDLLGGERASEFRGRTIALG
jgi:hypothetical protein